MNSQNDASSQRGRGPSRRVTEKVFTATLALMEESGTSRLSMEAIADRSGVHKTTLYRRWGSVNELIKAAISDVDMAEPAFQDTGSLLGDLQHLAKQFSLHFSQAEMVGILRVLAGNPDQDLAALMAEYWAERSSLFTALLDRAQERGDRICVEQFQLAIETMVGAMLVRVLMTRQDLDEPWVSQLGQLAFYILTQPLAE